MRAGCDCGDGCTGCATWAQELQCDTRCTFWPPPEADWEALAGQRKPATP
jgi:hypothetical protein